MVHEVTFNTLDNCNNKLSIVASAGIAIWLSREDSSIHKKKLSSNAAYLLVTGGRRAGEKMKSGTSINGKYF